MKTIKVIIYDFDVRFLPHRLIYNRGIRNQYREEVSL